jgi:hypothetical protein
MSNAREVITEFAELVKVKDPAKFWELIVKENKEKKYSLLPIKVEMKDGEITSNAEQVKILVDLVEKWAYNLSVSDNLDEINKGIKTLREIYVWINGSRKQVTRKFDEVKKQFTDVENDVKKLGELLKNRIDELKEQEYKKNEELLKQYFTEEIDRIKKEHNIDLDISIFEDFIQNKRKNKITTKKGLLTAEIKRQIDEKVEQVLEPILKEKETQKLKEQDLQKLALDLKDVNIYSLFLDELEQAKGRLEFLLDVAETAYPNATVEAKMQLKGLLKIAEANIAKVKAEQEKEILQEQVKKEQEEKNKKEQELKEKARKIQEKMGVVKSKNKFKLPLEELEVIASVEVEAENEDEAKEKILKMFKEQLELIDLIKI